MQNIAILIGTSKYDNLQNLDCCKSDLKTIKQLLESTENFDEIIPIENESAISCKNIIRETLSQYKKLNKIFFYYTGHGLYQEETFYYCPKDFTPSAPNKSGISQEEINILFRATEPELLVKVIDACNSGSPLYKSDNNPFIINKSGLKNIVQIASCLQDQNSLTGDPLSEFTQQFIESVLHQNSGKVYYSDIISSLRDKFMDNKDSTPYFISQGTGREVFIDDHTALDTFRKIYESIAKKEKEKEDIEPISVEEHPSMSEIAEIASISAPTKEESQDFIDNFSNALLKKFEYCEPITELYDVTSATYNEYKEISTKPFIVRVLNKITRPDSFVVTETERQRVRNPYDPFGMSAAAAVLAQSFANEEYVENLILELNCSISNVQLKIELTPKYNSLKKYVIIISFAPSIERCYLFKFMSVHKLSDWNSFELNGNEVNRGWYKLDWNQNTDYVVSEIHSYAISKIEEEIAKLSPVRSD